MPRKATHSGTTPVTLVENGRTNIQVPLFADSTMTDTDVIQTPSDRFHRWLLNMSLLIQEYRIGELMVWNEDLTALLAQPTDSALKLHVTKASTWVGLLYEFNLLQSAFTRMLLSDQATAVDRFEVDKLLKYHRNDDNELVPVEVEMSGLPALGVNAEVAVQIRFSVFWKISFFLVGSARL